MALLHRLSLILATAAAFTTVSAHAQERPIKIGTPLALTGALAEEGKKQATAYQVWLERINAAGGIDVGGKKRKVELISYDYQTDGNRAQQLAEKLINDDKVDFMTAPFGSGHTKIVAIVAERYNIPIVAVASSEPVHDQGLKNLFGTLAPSKGLISSMITQFKSTMPDVKTVAIVGRDDVFPKLMATALVEQAPKDNIKVVYQALYPVGALDHASTISAIRPLKPDWIFVSGYTQDLVLFRKQMSDLGVSAPIITMVTGPAYREFVDNLGALAENVTSATWWHHSTPYTGDDVFGNTKTFYDAIVAKGGHEPDYVHASSAVALIVLQKAIEKAGSVDRDKVRDALRTLDIATFYGPIRFREDGMNAARNLPIIQVQGGKPALLFPPEVRQVDMRLIKP